MTNKRHYLSYEEFYNKLAYHLPVGETWRLKCEDADDPDDNCNYTLVFAKHKYEAENGFMYDFIVYSYPKTLDAGLIQEDIDEGWDANISSVWNDITEVCNLKPFIYEIKN